MKSRFLLSRRASRWVCATMLCALPLLPALSQSHSETVQLKAQTANPSPNASENRMVYTLRDDKAQWPADKTKAVVEAMDAAVAFYNSLGEFPKQVTAGYNAATPTADGNINGNIRFGGSINRRVALHELGHVMGVGTHPKWQSFLKDGKWTGQYALAQLREFDGPNAELNADRMHFWPYGLNYDSESSPEKDRRHVLMVAAFMRDLGITKSEPVQGMAGVGTWNSFAEYKDVRVTKGFQVLFDSNTTVQSEVAPVWRRLSGQSWSLIGDPTWRDYTLSLKARKISGDEGFLIVFGSPGINTKSWWNLGGWGNTQHGLEVPGISTAQVPGRIETGRWYDIRVELNGSSVKCYLDDKLVQQGRRGA